MAILKTTEITGSLSVQDFIYGTLIGTSSFTTASITSVSASHAITASYAENAGAQSPSSSWASSSISSSYSLQANSAATATSSLSSSYATYTAQSTFATFNLNPQSPGGSSGGEIRWVGSTAQNGDWYFDTVNKDMRMLYVTASNTIQEIRLIPDVTNFGAWFYLPIRATYGVTGSLLGNASTATSASYALNAGATTHTEKFMVSASAFSGAPLCSAVTYVTPFANAIYTVSVVGEDARVWSVTNSTTGSIISTNSNQALSGYVYFRAEEI